MVLTEMADKDEQTYTFIINYEIKHFNKIRDVLRELTKLSNTSKSK